LGSEQPILVFYIDRYSMSRRFANPLNPDAQGAKHGDFAANICALAPYVTLTEANASFEAKPLTSQRRKQRTSPASISDCVSAFG
jgi:hypothetical protein